MTEQIRNRIVQSEGWVDETFSRVNCIMDRYGYPQLQLQHYSDDGSWLDWRELCDRNNADPQLLAIEEAPADDIAEWAAGVRKRHQEQQDIVEKAYGIGLLRGIAYGAGFVIAAWVIWARL